MTPEQKVGAVCVAAALAYFIVTGIVNACRRIPAAIDRLDSARDVYDGDARWHTTEWLDHADQACRVGDGTPADELAARRQAAATWWPGGVR